MKNRTPRAATAAVIPATVLTAAAAVIPVMIAAPLTLTKTNCVAINSKKIKGKDCSKTLPPNQGGDVQRGKGDR